MRKRGVKITMITLEPLQEKHRDGVLAVYNFYIRTSNAAYRREEVATQFFETFLENAKKLAGYALIDQNATVVGFCQLKPYSPLSTFESTVELTYFLMPDFTGMGIGSEILAKLTDDALRLGKEQLLASISGDNEISLKFHRKHGFTECARFRSIGNKFGEDFDIVYMQKTLRSGL